MKTKIILLAVAAIIVIGLAGGAYWWLSRPQIIAFSDDSRLTLLGVDYGRRHALPRGSDSSRGGPDCHRPSCRQQFFHHAQ
jgi:hypothetical protein